MYVGGQQSERLQMVQNSLIWGGTNDLAKFITPGPFVVKPGNGFKNWGWEKFEIQGIG